ncbi:MAG TPA: pyrroloquinoline quinone biosynthesis protein PqqB [Candidatus Acidoferrales bacterium]|nr:pyrroloquinoline quinone biosynthesis protein PqqB [Candidatus Acidoferrales bacterium]
MRIKVLGSAAGGGFPQWNCGCSNCSRLRSGRLKGGARTQAQVAVSSAPTHWVLLNASPDLRQQLLRDPDFAPSGQIRSTPIQGVVLTSADTDCVLGLLHLREFQPLHIYSTDGVRRVLTEENSLFRTLERSTPPVEWNALRLDRPTPIGSQDETSLCCRAIPLHGQYPDYVSQRLRDTLPREEAVIALEVAQGGKRLFYAPSLPGLGAEWKRSLSDSQLALVDGTFWTENELIEVRGEGKRAREIGHMPLSGPGGLLEQLEGARNVQRVLIHLNNTNPALDEESEANRIVREGGWQVAWDGMEFTL